MIKIAVLLDCDFFMLMRSVSVKIKSRKPAANGR
jgi:hypothetical protein